MKVPVISLLTRAGSAQSTDGGQARMAEQLTRAGLREGEPQLARLLSAEGGSRAGSSGPRAEASTRLLLEVGGQRLPVRSDQPLETGTLVRVMRAGNELRLMESLQQPSRSTLSQSLANRMPFQHDLGQGLSRLAAQTNDPALPQQIRQGLAQLTRLMPSTPAPQANTGSAPPGSTATPLSMTTPQTLTMPTMQNSAGSKMGPTLDNMSGPQVREWIRQSGLFREAQMLQRTPGTGAQSGGETQPDLKAQLVRLATQLLPRVSGAGTSEGGESLHRVLGRLQPMTSGAVEDTSALRFPSPPAAAAGGETASATGGSGGSNANMSPGEMLRLVAGMLNRLTVNQLHSQAASTGGDANAPTQTWILELPWTTGNQEVRIVQGRLEEYGPRDQDAEEDSDRQAFEREWQLTLALSFDSTGPLYFEVNLRGRQLRTRVWAEKPETVALVADTRGRLETALSRLDLDVVPVECMEGQPPARVTRLSQQLVDEHA
ncbi:MAG: flagellar hook-length control protein FliK [Pseudomonadota bacterium]